jgi:SAM-dependent methyltransferase
MELKPLLKSCTSYYGSDLIAADGVLQCNLEKPLPFEDKQFDVVTALDVIEHLDNPHAAIKELIRITKKTLIISLPNMYYIQFRWHFLLGRGLSGKYRFPVKPIVDRHRWVLSYQEGVDFICGNSQGYDVDIDLIYPTRNRTRLLSVPVQKFLGQIWPNLFVYGTLFEITVQ